MTARRAAAALLVVFAAGAAPAARAVTPADRHAALPARAMKAEPVTFRSAARDTVALDGWWFAGDGKGPVLVVFSRGSGTMADQLPSVGEFLARGFSVLTFDYRDFGPGRPAAPDTLRHLLFASRWVDDGVGAARYARSRAGERAVFGWGQDLGSAVGVAVAARPGRPLDAVAVEGLWHSALEQLRQNGTYQIPGVPEMHRRLVRGNDDPVSAVPTLQVPLFVVIAAKDDVTPPAITRMVARRSNSIIEQYMLDEAAHDGAEKTAGYHDAIAGWFRQIAVQMRGGPR